jgi:hypothetical protein
MRDLNRALFALLACAVPLLWLTPAVRAALQRRSPFVFYSAMLPLLALLCCGPVLRANGEVVLSPAPYRWLMALPGFVEIRVPLRFWMLGVLSLAIAGGLAFAHLAHGRTLAARALFAAAVLGLALDGGIHTLRLAAAPAFHSEFTPADRAVPLLELPMGGDWTQDWAATFRAAGHGRRILNGVSGYNPPHYSAPLTGLERHEPAVLAALAMLGPFDVVVPRHDGNERYITGSGLPSAAIREGADRAAYAFSRAEPMLASGLTHGPAGPVLPIAGVKTMRHQDEARWLTDGNLSTVWADAPQQFDQWIELDLGAATEVAAVSQALGDFPLDFPRRLAVELSEDGVLWPRVFAGGTSAHAFLGLADRPREGWVSIVFPAQRARYVRLRQLDSTPARWTVAEVKVYGAAGAAAGTATGR